MRFKVGDKVRIRKDLYFGGNYGIACNNDMPHYAGVETVITHITKFGNYALSADKGANYWSADILEPANEEADEIDQLAPVLAKVVKHWDASGVKPEPEEMPQAPWGFHTGEKLFFGLDDGSASTITNAVKAFLDQADFKDMPPIEMSLRKSNEPDMIQKPPHYNKFTFQPIGIIAEVTNYYEGSTAFHIGTVLKYLCRAPFKGKLLEDLKKANYYLTRAIEEMEDDGE